MSMLLPAARQLLDEHSSRNQQPPLYTDTGADTDVWRVLNNVLWMQAESRLASSSQGSARQQTTHDLSAALTV